MKDNNSQNNNTSKAIANQSLQKKSDRVSLEPPTKYSSNSIAKTTIPFNAKKANSIQDQSNKTDVAKNYRSLQSNNHDFSSGTQQLKKTGADHTLSVKTDFDTPLENISNSNKIAQLEIDNSPSKSLPVYEKDEKPSWQKIDDETNEKKRTFPELYDGTLIGLAKGLKNNYVPEGMLSDNVLLNVLQEPLESNWFKAKDVLTTDSWPGLEKKDVPPHEHSIAMMQAMVNMRGRVWQNFATNVMQEKIKPALIEKKKKESLKNINVSDENDKNFGLKDSVGSESVTSDIDLSAKGENTELGVAIINVEFRAKYNQEPGAFFDINVYSSDWMFGGSEIKSQTDKEYLVKPNEEENLSEKGKKKKNDQNEVWSMVKIRRNMDESDWAAYKNSILIGGLIDAEKKEMEMKFMEVEFEYKTFKLTIEQNVQEAVLKAEKAANHEEAEANKKKVVKKPSAFEKDGVDHHAEEAMEMEVSNRQYEKIIEKVKELRLQIQKLKVPEMLDKYQDEEIETLILEMHNQVSRGLTYANEVYATQGAVLHTVYGKQGAIGKLKELNDGQDKNGKEVKSNFVEGKVESVKYDLTKEMYLQSMNENVGDTLHSLNHFEHDPQYATYRAGKYIDRLCEAVRELITEDEAKKISSYKQLFEIGDASVKEKKGAAGADPMATHKESSFFHKYTKSQLSTVKTRAMALGSEATIKFKNNPKEKEK